MKHKLQLLHLLLAGSSFDLFMLAPDALHCLTQNLHSLLDLTLSDCERRYKPQSVGSAGDDQQSPLSRSGDDWSRVGVKLKTQNQSLTADLLDLVGEPLLQRAEVFAERLLLSWNSIENLWGRQARENVGSHTTSKRVSAKCCTVITSLDVVADKVVNNGGSNGETVAECLCSGHDIRVALFGEERVRPEVTRPAQTALDLIVDQNSANFRAALTEGEEEFWGSNVDTALSLNGLNNDTTSRVRHQVVDSGNIVEITVTESGYHGREWRLVFGVGSSAQASHGAAVERVVERDELVLILAGRHRLSDLASKLDGGLIRFGTAVTNECTGRAGETTSCVCELDQLLGKQTSVWVVVKIRGVHKLLGLYASQQSLSTRQYCRAAVPVR
jgi:hypothetical protein